VNVVAIEAHQHRKQMASRALSVAIDLASILFIRQYEVRIVRVFVGYIYSVSHALEAKWRH
jgi:hypothetical protein